LKKKRKKPDDYGDDPHVADFGPDISASDIKGATRVVELTVGGRKVVKTVPADIRW